jgi:hypothetical protein
MIYGAEDCCQQNLMYNMDTSTCFVVVLITGEIRPVREISLLRGVQTAGIMTRRNITMPVFTRPRYLKFIINFIC